MRRFRFIALLMGICIAASPLYAQFETAEVLGTVRDTSGSAIRDASVTLINRDTGIQFGITTDENGRPKHPCASAEILPHAYCQLASVETG